LAIAGCRLQIEVKSDRLSIGDMTIVDRQSSFGTPIFNRQPPVAIQCPPRPRRGAGTPLARGTAVSRGAALSVCGRSRAPLGAESRGALRSGAGRETPDDRGGSGSRLVSGSRLGV